MKITDKYLYTQSVEDIFLSMDEKVKKHKN